jgi:methylenetetrahydrofolate reductase (NADPH)
VVDPAAEPMEAEIERMEGKVTAGAEFFQTQPIFNEELYAHFVKKAGYLDTPILAGILLLKSAGMARYMNERIPGVNVPKHIIDALDGAKDPLRESVEIAQRTISIVRDCSRGVHIMTVHREDKVSLILDALGR